MVARVSKFPHPIAILLHNRTQDLAEVLASLRDQDLPPNESKLWIFLDSYSGSKSEFFGIPDRTKQVLDIAFAHFPMANFYLNDSNKGIAKQFDIAERFLFATYEDAEWVSFFEDDLMLAPNYLSSLVKLTSYAGKFDEICQVSVSGDAVGEQFEGDNALYLANHAWGFSLKRSHFEERQKLVSQYLEILEGRPYFQREHRKVIDHLSTLGLLAGGSSQDHVKRAIMQSCGKFFLTAGGHGGRYVGSTGDNFTPQTFKSLGYLGGENAKAIGLDITKIKGPDFGKLASEFHDQLRSEREHFDRLHEPFSISKIPNRMVTLPSAITRRTSMLIKRSVCGVKNRANDKIKDGSTFTEKLQNKMRHDRRETLTRFADKVAVREYVAEKVGEKYLIERYQTGSSWQEMDFSSLPEEFVFKPSHASRAGVLVYKNASPKSEVSKEYMSLPWNGYLSLRPEDLDLDLLKAKAHLWLNQKYGNVKVNFEWAYQNIPPKLILEKYLPGPDGKPPTNLNFFMFNGECKFISIVNHFSEYRVKVNPEWKYLPVVDPQFPLRGYADIPKKPDNLEELIHIATRLSNGIDFVRVDLYNEGGVPLFSELTNYPQAGVYPTDPPLYGRLFGHYLQNDPY
jgi:hypothetical protein